MTPRRRALGAVVAAAAIVASSEVAQGRQTQPAKAAVPATRAARIAFVPIDDRPRSLGDVVRIAAIADVDIVTPPAGLLSRHLKTGDGDGLAKWLDTLDARSVDAVVVSTDMLAYGGLLGSRTGRVKEPDALGRLEAIGRLKTRRADLPVLAFTSLLRLAPNDDGGNPKWREALTSWARHSATPGNAEVAAKAQADLPAGLLDAYRATRARNVASTRAAIDLAVRGSIDMLVIGDDEDGSEGVHVAERAEIAAAIVKSGASDRVLVRAGVEEAAPLLVARAIVGRLKAPPSVRVSYASDAARDSMRDLVTLALKTAGVRTATAKDPAAVALEVFASGEPAPAEALAKRVLSSREPVAVADVGTVEGGSLALLETLRSARAFPRLSGFAAGPTPEAAVTTALVQALALAVFLERPAAARPADVAGRVSSAHVRQLLARAIEDVLYDDVVAPQAVEDVLTPRGASASAVPEAQLPRLSTYVEKELTPLAQSLVADFGARPWQLPSRSSKPIGAGIVVKDVTKLAVGFPWADMAEPEIAFELVVDAATRAQRPPAPRILR